MNGSLRALISDWSDRLVGGDPSEVTATMNELVDRLTALRDGLTPAAWEEAIVELRSSELMPILLEDPLTRWAYHRPRGFPGDAGLIDMIYARGEFSDGQTAISTTGQRICAANLTRPGCQAVRYRKHVASEFLRSSMAVSAHPALLGIAVGHMREVEVELFRGGLSARIVALDADPSAVAQILLRLPQVEGLCMSMHDVQLGRLDGQLFDACWSPALYNYLSDAAAEQLLAKQIDLVQPGGRVLISNFATNAADRGYMEAFMDWRLVHRDEQDMENLARRAHPDCTTRLYREPSRQMVFLEVIRNI